MDDKFKPAEEAILSGDLARFDAIVAAAPELATARSECSHPTLLQCLVLSMPPADGLERSVEALADRGAELTDPLIAAASLCNTRAGAVLLRRGANIEGNGLWSPLEEALYWNHAESVELLLKHGAKIDNLRKAAGLGRLDYVEKCLHSPDDFETLAGHIASPWFHTHFPDAVKFDRQQIIDNALVYAAAWGHIAVAEKLLAHGANINALPAGFDFTGTPLHYAALEGRDEMADFSARGWCRSDDSRHQGEHAPRRLGEARRARRACRAVASDVRSRRRGAADHDGPRGARVYFSPSTNHDCCGTRPKRSSTSLIHNSLSQSTCRRRR